MQKPLLILIALATGSLLIASPTSAQNRQPATRVIWEGDMNGGYYCKLDNGVTRHKGEGPCTEFLGVCTHENGYKVNCSDCNKFGNCR